MAEARDIGTEVVGLMRTKTGDGAEPAQQAPLSPSKSSALEKHISTIPQDDEEDDNTEHPSKSKAGLLKKIKNKISRKNGSQEATEAPTDQSLTGPDMPTSIKRQISDIPPNDYDSETEGLSKQPHQSDGEHDRHDSGTGGSEFEVSPILRLSSEETRNSGSVAKRPELDRHISQVPEKDGADSKPRPTMSRLERTISHIPQDDDYDSDDENDL